MWIKKTSRPKIRLHTRVHPGDCSCRRRDVSRRWPSVKAQRRVSPCIAHACNCRHTPGHKTQAHAPAGTCSGERLTPYIQMAIATRITHAPASPDQKAQAPAAPRQPPPSSA